MTMTLVNQRIKVSWKSTQREDGTYNIMHVAGICLSEDKDTIVLKGNGGEIFTITFTDIVKLRKLEGDQ